MKYQKYVLGSADPVLHHTDIEIGLALKAALLVKPRIILPQPVVLDGDGFRDILDTKEAGSSDPRVGVRSIEALTSTSDKLSEGKPILSITDFENTKTGLDFFKSWAGVEGGWRTDAVYSSTLSNSIDTSKTAQELLSLYPAFGKGVKAIDRIFIRNGAVERVPQTHLKEFRSGLEEGLQEWLKNRQGNGKTTAEVKQLAEYLLNKIKTTDNVSRSFVIRECQAKVGKDIYHREFRNREYLTFRDELIDRTWRIAHGRSVSGDLWEGFQRDVSSLRRILPWFRTDPRRLRSITLPYMGKYLNEVSIKEILALRSNDNYLNQLRGLQQAMAKADTGPEEDLCESFLDQLAEAFPSSRGKSPKQKRVTISNISGSTGMTAAAVVTLVSLFQASVPPDAIMLGDLALIGGGFGYVVFAGLARFASSTLSPLRRQFKAFGLQLVK